MSDKLSSILQSINNLVSTKKETSEQRLIKALDKALQATTPERPGCPWDIEEEENDRRNSGYWLRESD